MPPPGAALHREAGAGAQETHVGPRAAPSQEVGTRAAGTRGVLGAAPVWPGAALSQEVETGAVGTRGAPGATLRQEASAAPSQSMVGYFLVISS
jgi:hypothetical protein